MIPSEQDLQIRDMARQFAQERLKPFAADWDREHRFPAEALREMGELGFMGMLVPEDWGGAQTGHLAYAMALEEIAAGDGACSTIMSVHNSVGCMPILKYGSAEQKQRFLQPLAEGKMLGAFALTEPQAGSDASDLRTRARRDGEHYVLNGSKQFITNGSFANLYTVFAKIDKKHFTAFLVDRDCEGLVIGPEEKKLGIKGSSTTQIILDNCKVPAENLLGEIGKGHKIAFNVLNVGRFKLAAGVTGAAKAAFGEGVKYANERKQFGRAIGSFGAVQEKLADMTTDIFASESLVYRLAGLLDTRLATIDKGTANYYEEYQKGIEEYAPECAISKVYCSEVLASVVDEVLQIHGGYGFVSEYPAERFYRDERINRIFEGTNEINRLLIPGMILRKAMKGELPLQKEAMRAFESLMTPSFEEIDDSVPFAREKALLQNLKTVFLILSGTAVQKYMGKLQNEQEVLLAAADMSIQIFALESAVLRAEKGFAEASEHRKELLAAVIKVCAFNATELLSTAAKKGAFYIEEGDNLTMILSGIRRFAKYDATGLLQAKRTLAGAAIETEKYVF
jgi:alkylation response protein AidB-like acyl-CoA dehydrogenase